MTDFFINHPWLALLIGAILLLGYIYLLIFEIKEGDEDEKD